MCDSKKKERRLSRLCVLIDWPIRPIMIQGTVAPDWEIRVHFAPKTAPYILLKPNDSLFGTIGLLFLYSAETLVIEGTTHSLERISSVGRYTRR